MSFGLFSVLVCFMSWLVRAEDEFGLSSEAVPSLVLLGTAKGGTTDLWHIIHNLKIGFEQYEASSVDHIQTKKELDFFSGVLCTSSSRFECPPEHLKILLRCPNSILNEYSLEGIHMVNVCQEWLQQKHINSPKYTMTASPSLMYEYIVGSHAITSVASQTGAYPLYIMLLKDPVQRIMSLYNHWYKQEGENGYSLDLEELVQLELSILATPRAKKLLNQMIGASLSIKGSRPLKAAELLRQHMTAVLSGVGKYTDARLNLRPFGLVLDGLYLPQIVGWWKSKAHIKNRLLIVKSEYFKDHREECIRDVLLPFLFPSLPQHERDAVMSKAIIPRISNQKTVKDTKALLSPHTQQKLSRFYRESNLESFLFSLQEKGVVTIVPSLSGQDEQWWPTYED